MARHKDSKVLLIQIIHGPNLNLLGERKPEIYGHTTLEELHTALDQKFRGSCRLEYFQSNREGEIIDKIQRCNASAIVINPGAFAHYSLAIADALHTFSGTKVEVHISNVHAREEFRKKLVTAGACNACISGTGIQGYDLAIQHILKQH